MFERCDVQLVSTPFGINGIECYEGNVSLTTPRIIIKAPLRDTLVCKGAPSVRQLSLKEKSIGNNNKGMENPVIIASLHQRGNLIFWDADTLDILSNCKHYGCSVVQCVINQTYIFVRVENQGRGFSDAESKVYVWHAKSFELFQQIAAHSTRVTSMAVSDEDDAQFATAGTDHLVHIWDLKKDVVNPIKSISTAGIPFVKIYSRGMIIGGFMNTPLVVWNAETGKAVHTPKDSGDIITVIRWLHDSKAKNNCTKNGRDNKNNDCDSRSHFPVLLAGYNDGFVKGWTIDKKSNLSLSLNWGCKVHRAHVTDLCGHDNVVLSWSTLDGAFFLLPESAASVQVVSYGVRAALLESHSKKAFIGLDDGSVKLFLYENFLIDKTKPVLLMSFQPHISAITGMFLQLRDDLSWDRFICSAADGTILFMDYKKSGKSGRCLQGMVGLSAEFMEGSGPILFPRNKSGGICAIDPIDFLPYSQEPNVMKKRTVTALRWVESLKKLIVGCKEGIIGVFQGSFAGDGTPSFSLIEERPIEHYSVLGISSSVPDDSFALIILQKNSQHCEGAFIIIGVKNVDLFFPLQTLASKILLCGNLIISSKSESQDYTVLLQLHDGTLEQYTGNYASKSVPSFVRVLLKPSFFNIYKTEFFGWSRPSNYILNVLPTEAGGLKVTITCAEGATVKKISFDTQIGSSIDLHNFDKKENLSPSKKPDGNIAYLQRIEQCGFELAVLREFLPTVDIIAADGEYLYRVGHDGSVVDLQGMGLRHRSRVFLHDCDTSDSIPVACSASYCAAAYYMAIGYNDGLIQLFDITQRVVFARFTSLKAMVRSLWAFPTAFVYDQDDGCCHVDKVPRRVMYDDPESSHLTANTSHSYTQASRENSMFF